MITDLRKRLREHEQQSTIAPNRLTRSTHKRIADKYRAALECLEVDRRVVKRVQMSLELV